MEAMFIFRAVRVALLCPAALGQCADAPVLEGHQAEWDLYLNPCKD
jgi:hypothetical protein